MFQIDYRSIKWWYWLVTVLLLTAGLSGWPLGFLLAIGVTVFQLAHFLVERRSFTAFPVQVRIAYLLLLLLALPAPLQWIYWLPTLGTWALVLFSYCPMARTLSLMPWNRKRAFTFALLRRTYLTAPVKGSFLNSV